MKNNNSNKKLVIVFITVLSTFISINSSAVVSGISKQQTANIINGYADHVTDNFTEFLQALQKDNRFQGLHASIMSFLAHDDLDEQAHSKIFRLMGIYASIKYGEQAITTLHQFVEIPTDRVDGQEQHDNPNIHKIGERINELSKMFGLEYRNIDNRVFEVTLPGSRDVSKEGTYLIGLHAHADVVPANKDNWVLDDGTQLDPFKVTTIGDRMYGRGTEDDKNGIVVALYAMKLIKEENIPLKQTFRLLVDTTEETIGSAMPYYMERNVQPQYNLALDGDYPVVIAEKGYGVVMAKFPVRNGRGQGAELISITGGLATNQVPAKSIVLINSNDAVHLKSQLSTLAGDFIAANGNNFSIDLQMVEGNNNQLSMTVTGVSAHSSAPESGINPLARMLAFIDQANDKIMLKQNHITDAAQYASEIWGLDFYGKKLGIDYRNDFMGPLTAALTQVILDEETLQLAVNLRIPKGKTLAQLENEIKSGIISWKQNNTLDVAIDYSMNSEPMYRNPEGIWVNTLLDVATESLDIERKFGSSGGGTSAKTLPNGVQFGLSLATEKYTGHNSKEFKSIDQFLLDLQIVTEMIMAIGHLDKL